MTLGASVMPVVMVVLITAGCGVDRDAASHPASQAAIGSAAESASPLNAIDSTPLVDRVPLPTGFPVLPGAVPVPMSDDDTGLIAEWSSDQLGSAAYDFYVAALPDAGYPIVGLYPGGEVALIRFRAPGGAIWQMVSRGGVGGAIIIEIRLDRP